MSICIVLPFLVAGGIIVIEDIEFIICSIHLARLIQTRVRKQLYSLYNGINLLNYICFRYLSESSKMGMRLDFNDM